jgi:hypothetical protein
VDGDRCERALDEQEAVRLAARAKALADATRLRLAAVLGRLDELSVCDLAWVAGPAENLIAHHCERCARPDWSRAGVTARWSSTA